MLTKGSNKQRVISITSRSIKYTYEFSDSDEFRRIPKSLGKYNLVIESKTGCTDSAMKIIFVMIDTL